MIFRVIPDAASALAAFKKGEITQLPFTYTPAFYTQIDELLDTPGVRGWHLPSIYGRDLFINVDKPPFDDPKLREAISYAIDRDTIHEKALFNQWRTLRYVGNPFALGEFLNEDVIFPEFDADEAGRLLDEAGYTRGTDGVRLTARINAIPFEDAIKIAEVMKETLRELGIELVFEQLDMATYMGKMTEGDWDLSVYVTRFGPDPSAYQEHFGTGGARNFMKYSDAEMDEILEQATLTLDVEERKEYYYRAQEIIFRDNPISQ
jgi:peptide/nickel transport system substrate-binding protein